MQLLQAVYDNLEGQKKSRAVVSISKIKTETWLEVTSTAKLSIKTAHVPATSKKNVPAFGWEDRNERAQAHRYVLQDSLLSALSCSRLLMGCTCSRVLLLHSWDDAIATSCAGICHICGTLSASATGTLSGWMQRIDTHQCSAMMAWMLLAAAAFEEPLFAVADRLAVKSLTPQVGLRLLFELRRNIAGQASFKHVQVCSWPICTLLIRGQCW